MKNTLFLSAVGITSVLAALAAQQPADQSLAAIKAAPGLEVKLWATEPMLANPTNITVDERGRVWVLEGVNYRRASRKLPDLRPEGDRIVILEDTDNDGRADKSKVFDQGPHLRVPLGIAVLGDKVYVSQSPDIVVYTKDAADAIVKKETLLTGFAGIDHDHGLHAVAFGPDGKYYFNHGNVGFDVTDRSGTRFLSQGTGANTRPEPGYYEGVVFRMNPDGTGLEVIGQNFRNPYEVAVDSFANVFQTDNDDDGNAWVRLLYNMEGGNYGFRGPLNRTWLEDRGTHWHMELPGVVPVLHRIGAGSPCGLLVYEGTLLPAKYRGALFHADAGRRTLAAFTLSAAGAGFSARSEDAVYGGSDTWTRPTDAAVAPDGAVFIADWYDPGVGGHQMGDPTGNRGRIYRLAPAGNKPQSPKLDVASTSGLTSAFASGNESTRYAAHMAIAQRGNEAVPLLQTMWRQSDPILKARALWILGGLGDAGKAAVQEALRDKDPRMRVLGLRVARLHGSDILAVSKPLLRDGSPQVRREILLLLRDPKPALMLPPYLYKEQVQPSPAWLDAVAELASQYDGKDRWYLEAIGIAARGREDALYARMSKEFAGTDPRFSSIVWELRPKSALPDLVSALHGTNAGKAPAVLEQRMQALNTIGAMQWPEAAKAVEALILNDATPPALAERAMLIYTQQLFSTWMDSRTSAALPAIMKKALAAPATQRPAIAVAEALEDTRYMADLVALAKSESVAADTRAAALDSIAARRDPKYLADLQSMAEGGSAAVRVAALKAIGSLTLPDLEPWTQKLVVSDAPNEVRAEAVRLLARTLPGLTAILDMAADGRLPAELKTLAATLTNYATPPPPVRRGMPQSPVAIRVNRAAPPSDPAYVAIRERAAKVLPMAAAKPAPTALELEFNYVGKADNGRKVFDADGGCAACHSLVGKKMLGPDLAKIGAKYGRQAMLDSILNPSDAIGPEYMMTVVTLKNGDRLQGLIMEESADRVVLQTAADQSQRVRPADIASRQPIRVSLMPEGLLDALSHQQIADLLEFLTGLK